MKLLSLLIAASGARGAQVNVLEAFETIDDGLFADTGAGLGLGPAFPLSGTVSIDTVPHASPYGQKALRVEYDVEFTVFNYGFAMVGRVLNNTRYACAGASHLALSYRVAEPQSVPRAASLLVTLLDGSDCAGPACAMPLGFALENFHSFNYVLDDTDDGWREFRVGLCGSDDAFDPFLRLDGVGPPGNNRLDPDALQGFQLTVAVTDIGLGNPTKGALEFDDLRCVVPEPGDEPVDPCAAEACAGATKLAVRFDTSRARREIRYGHRSCCGMCAAEAWCNYFIVDTGLDTEGGRFPTCYLFDAVPGDAVIPVGDPQIEAFWMTDTSELCDACACTDEAGGYAADCRGRDLATVPAALASPRSLDLSDNPRLGLVGPGAFAGFGAMETLVLPAGLAYVAPDAGLPGGVETVVAGNARPGNFISGPSDAFGDVCCGRGSKAGGLEFCDLKPDVPGVTDAYYYGPSILIHLDLHLDPPRPLSRIALITPDSIFRAEASESREKCGAYCAEIAECVAFVYRNLEESGGFLERFCYLMDEAPDRVRPVDEPDGRFYAGLPPRTRAALMNATVAAAPAVLRVSESTGYAGTLEISLGADPLRGAVWVTPRLGVASDLAVSFDPPRVALYDADTVASVRVAVAAPVERDAVLPIVLATEACDSAFTFDELEVRRVLETIPSDVRPPEIFGDAAVGTVQLDVEAPHEKDSSNRKARRIKRQGITAAIVCACAVGAAGILWLGWRARKTALKKRKLEAERALLVQEQCSAAVDRIGEFQAHFCALPGDKFLRLEELKPHETLRRDIVTYDTVGDVRKAAAEGRVFAFLSHQWLGFREPDPDHVHILAMKQAVGSVAEASGKPVDEVMVWVDIASIPQANKSVQKTTIASLPTFASVCDFFVVVAPTTTHHDTKQPCDSRTYRGRAWCRAEIMSCWARNGTENMFVSTNSGLKPLAASERVLLEALDVFAGELTCDRLRHPDGQPCDREQLMLPMLGLYAEIYRDRNGVAKETYEIIEPIKDKMYPKTFSYTYRVGGVDGVEEKVLFGDLIAAVELGIELDEAPEDDPIWRRKAPDFKPGTRTQHHDAYRGAAHGMHGSLMTRKLSHSVSDIKSLHFSRSLRASRSLHSQGSGDGALSPRDGDGSTKRHVRKASAASSVSFDDSALPLSARSSGRRPQYSRADTWRTPAPLASRATSEASQPSDAPPGSKDFSDRKATVSFNSEHSFDEA